MCEPEESSGTPKKILTSEITNLTEKERSFISKIRSSRNPGLYIKKINHLLDWCQLRPHDISCLELLLEPREGD